MEVRQLTTFRAVARLRSFSRAAETLDYAQSSVTAQVQALEQELGVPLFERLGKRIALTEAGQRLLLYADQILRLAEEASQAVALSSEPSGTLQVGAAESICTYRLPPVLLELQRRYPRIQLVFNPGLPSDQRRAILEGALDVAFVLGTQTEYPGLVCEALRPEPLVLLTHPAHRLAGSKRVEPEDLAGEPMLLTEAGCTYREMFERILQNVKAQPERVITFSSVEAIKVCAMAGMGLTILPRMVAEAELADGRLVALAWAGPELELSTQLIWHKDKWLSPALRAFLEIARARTRVL